MTTSSMQIRTFITNNFAFGQASDVIDDNASLIEGGIIDSTGILELVSFIESELMVAVADADIVPENLGSIAAIAAYVDRRRAGALMPAAAE